MKVLFDHQLFAYQRYGGASKYFAMLIKHLPNEIWETTSLISNNQYVDHLDLFPHKHFFPKLFFRGQGRIMNEMNKPYSFNVLQKQNYDVFHQTHFETYCLRAIGNKPMVTTFHDINFSTLNPKPKTVRDQKKSLSRANHIIAISENTKRDLLELFDIDESKVSVIYHGIIHGDIEYSQTRICEYPYILYVGTRDAHKNFSKFIRAFARVHKLFPDIKVICTYKPFNKSELALFNELHISDAVLHCNASEAQMNQLYHDAEFFCFPSLYEGFGMPILEAFINGCPVLLANTSCFPEIAQDAGLYFSPNDIDDIVEKMVHIIECREMRNTLIDKGNIRVRDFSWEKCAQEHINVYNSLL